MIERIRDLLAVKCEVPACSRGPEPYVVDGSVLLLCPGHMVDVEIEVRNRRGSE